MFRSRSVLVSLVLLSWLAVPHEAGAQPITQLKTIGTSGDITANGGAVTLTGAGGMTSLLIQTVGTFSLTWEAQCAGDGTTFDTDDELPVTLIASSPTAADSVATNVEGLYTATIAGCRAVRVIATAYTSGTMTVTLTATPTGGGSSSGGGGGTNAAASATGSAVPASADYQGVNIGGTLTGVTGLSVGTARAPTVAIVDSSGNQISTFGGSGGTSVNEDVASADAQPGTPAFTVRNNTLTAATGADGDYQPEKSTAAGAQYIAPTFADVVASTGVGASGAQTQRVVTATDSTIGTVTAVTTVSTVTNVATIGTSVTPGTAAANLGKAEDAAHTSADVGVMALGVRTDVPASLAGTTNDYTPFILDALNKVWTTGSYAEDGPHTSTDPLIAIGCIRRDTTPSSSSGTAADYSNCNIDANGRVYVQAVIYDSAGAEKTVATDRAEDAAHVSGDTGPAMMAKRTDVAAVSSGTTEDYSTVNVDALGLVWARHLDPCSGVAKTFIAINISTATTTEITPSLAGASTNYYVCSINLVTAAANNVALTDDDTDNCASVTSGLAGGTTAASGWNFAANGGLTFGNGDSSVFKTAGTNRVLCLVTSAATQLSGSISVVAAP